MQVFCNEYTMLLPVFKKMLLNVIDLVLINVGIHVLSAVHILNCVVVKLSEVVMLTVLITSFAASSSTKCSRTSV